MGSRDEVTGRPPHETREDQLRRKDRERQPEKQKKQPETHGQKPTEKMEENK